MPAVDARRADPEADIVVDLKKLSEALGRSSPEEDLRRDLQRNLSARNLEIDQTLASGQSYVLCIADGRRIRISRKPQTAEAVQ